MRSGGGSSFTGRLDSLLVQLGRGFRSTGWPSLLLWGLALPGSLALAHASPASAGDASEVRGLGRRPVLLPLRPDPAAATGLNPAELVRRRFEAESQVRQKLGPHGVSLKAQQWRSAWSKQAAGEEPRVLHVLLIRIAFETDESGPLTSITEDGNFQLQPDSLAVFDPPPHDKAYFEAHLRGLSEYWSSMSDGRLQIDSRVLPEGDQDAYLLRDIADYGPGYGGFWSIDGLVAVVRDMILAADRGTAADGSANLADYDFDDPDTYIIFAHSGGDLQSNLVFEPGQEGYSPNDIPTFFVLLGDEDYVPLESIDSDTNEPGLLTECSVVPESTSQDGLLGSIAAALYHEFGHALGLPDLYDTFTGLPAVGYWDLMDTGTNVVATAQIDIDAKTACEARDCDWIEPDDGSDPFCACSVVGLMPPSISMWSKWYLGWVEPTVIGGRTQQAVLYPTHLQNREEKAALLDCGSDEFFLVEHRWIAPTGEGLYLRRDPQTGVVLYLARDDGSEDPPNSHNYDFFLPWPGGALVWHVRQDRVNESIAQNLVQIDPHRRGLELVEADGIQDIGVFEFTTIGFVGSETDAFREETVIPLSADESIVYPRTATEITPTSLPSTQSGFRVPTGVSIRDFPQVVADESQPILIEADIAGLVDLDSPAETIFPVSLPFVTGSAGLVPVRADAQSLGWFEFDAGAALVFAAQPADASQPWGLYAYSLLALPRFLGQERIAEFTAPLTGPLIVAEGLADGAARPALVAVTVDGRVRAFPPDGVPSRGPAAELWPDASLGGPVDTPATLVNTSSGRFVVAASRADKTIYVLDDTGQPRPGFSAAFPIDGQPLQSGVLAADLDGVGGADELVFVAGGSVFGTEIDGTLLAGFPVRLPGSFAPASDATAYLLAWPLAGGPDRVILIAPVGRGAVAVALDHDGQAWSAATFGRPFDTHLVAEPSLGDLDGDGRLELLVATRRRLWVRNEAGIDATGFPIVLTEQYLHGLVEDGPGGPPLVADLDADRVNEVMLLSEAGLVYTFEFDGQLATGYPRRYSGTHTGAPMLLDYDDGEGPARALVLMEARGDTLVPGRRAQSARLTAADLGPASGLAPQDRPAEWLGRGGGPHRTYRGAEGGVASPVTGPAALVRKSPAILLPNPIRSEPEATARFFSAAQQTARLTVYTLEGQEILRREQSAEAGVMAEVRWDPRSLVSGAYVCRLEYVGSDGPTTELMSLYVER